ncbi:MAG: FeoA family protein [Magnetospirillum sp.]|nr:FeoA family protein [Magnetospirillum sp.]
MPFDRSAVRDRDTAPSSASLASAGVGARVRITGVSGGGGLQRRLTELGLPRGAELVVVGRMGRRGPVIVAAHGTRVVVGSDMAEAIAVSVLAG